MRPVDAPPTVLLVCFGNLCRSPMAHGILGDRLEPDWRVCSAGTHAFDGSPPAAEAIRVTRRHAGVDISAQRSALLRPPDLEAAAHVLTMTESQALHAARLRSDAAPRIRLLGAFAPDPDASGLTEPGGGRPAACEVPDPMGGSTREYERCLDRLSRCAEAFAGWLRLGAPPEQAPPPLSEPGWNPHRDA